MVVLFALLGVEPFAVSDVLILCVVEKKVFDAQFFRQLAGVFYGGVLYPMGMVFFRVGIETEGLMEEPCAVFGVGESVLPTGLVAAAGELPAVTQLYAEAELLCLHGSYVKEGDVSIEDGPALAVRYFNKMHLLTQSRSVTAGKQQLRHRFQDRDDLAVGIDIELVFR